jgi:hypothetical protein
MVNNIRYGIKQAMEAEEVAGAKVRGIASGTGLEVTISTLKNVEDFGRHGYNDLIEEFRVALNRFADSRIIALLIEAARRNPYFFSQQ